MTKNRLPISNTPFEIRNIFVAEVFICLSSRPYKLTLFEIIALFFRILCCKLLLVRRFMRVFSVCRGFLLADLYKVCSLSLQKQNLDNFFPYFWISEIERLVSKIWQLFTFRLNRHLLVKL